MRNLFKNIFRYSLKNKTTILCLILLFLICIISILTLGFLSNNLVSVYNKVLSKTKLHEIVINEKFSNSEQDQIQKQNLLDALTKNFQVEARPFESMNILASNADKYKVIKYSPKYTFDTLYMFDYAGLPTCNHMPTIPAAIDYSGLITYAGYDLTHNTYDPNLLISFNNKNIPINKVILAARQVLVFLAAKADWKNNTNYQNDFIQAVNELSANKNIDPLGKTNIGEIPAPNSKLEVVGTYLNQMLNPNDANYTPINNQGYRLIFNLINKLGSPIAANYDDYNSYTAIVSPTYLRYNNKKVFSYQEYANHLKILNDNSSTASLQNNSANTTNFLTYFNSISDDYKIYVDSMPYLIIGSGLTPDFTYPIISFENVIVDFQKETVLYANSSGYARCLNSWATAPQENLILIKLLNNNQDPNLLVKEINELATKYVGFPDGVQVAYLVDDENNMYSPTALRVKFLSDLTLSINAITLILFIFLMLVCIFVLIIILNKFIKQNIKSLFVIIANGMSKAKAISSILIMPILPICISAIIGYVVAYFLQKPAISIFETYWSLPTYIPIFNPGWIFLVAAVLMIISTIVIYISCYISLRHSVADGINYNDLKLGWFSRAAIKPLWWANIIVKFRTSIAFSSFGKLFLLSFIATLFATSVTFLGSTGNDFYNSTQTTLKSNTSTFQIDLETPTVQGGQYYAVGFDQIGTIFQNNPNPNQNPITQWGNVHFPSIEDLSKQKTNLDYLYNKTQIQFIMNIILGINGISTSNPWNDLAGILVPPNVSNVSQEFTTTLYQDYLIDNRIIDLKNMAGYFFDFLNDTTKLDDLKNNYIKPTNKIIATNDPNLIYDMRRSGFNNDIRNIVLYMDNENITPDNVVNKLKSKLDLTNTTYINNNSVSPICNLNWSLLPTQITLNKIDQLNAYEININNVDFNNNINNPSLANFIIPTYSDIANYLYNITSYHAESSLTKNQMLINNIINNENMVFDIQSKQIIKDFGTRCSNNFLYFITNVLNNKYYQQYLYKIMYNTVPYNPKDGDELYCYVNGSIKTKIKTDYKYNHNIKIIGIAKNSQIVKLFDINNHKEINDILFNPSTDNTIPLIVNAYAAKKYNLKINDVIDVFANNNIDRYTIKQNSSSFNNDDFLNQYSDSYKVVGISDSTKDDQFYISINNAQDILGLYNPNNLNFKERNQFRKLNNNFNSNIGGFNGIYLKDNLSLLTNSTALYANSGNYPGIDYFEENDVMNSIIKNVISNGIKGSSNPYYQQLWQLLYSLDSSWAQANLNNPNALTLLINSFNTNPNLVIKEVINKLNNIYGKVAYNSILNTPYSLPTTLQTFNEITGTVLNLEILVVSLVSILSIIILFTFIVIIINDFLKLIALLKIQGFSNHENALNILSVFIPCWIFATILSIPLNIICLYLFKEFAFVKMGILVAASFNWWLWFLVIAALGLIFVGIIFFASKLFSKINLNEALKW